MTTYDDIRKIVSKLPGAIESEERFGYYVVNKGKEKGFLWLWNERIDPKKSRVPNPRVIAVIVRSLTEKDIILGSDDGTKFFTEPHYNGFPAVLVRLDGVEPDDIEDLLIEAWKRKAPPSLVKEYEQL
ncbi:MAG TPA: hypothetical protein VG944_06280 [Fimbriimonas sp.]|nr:hypothetical protein [Fimbriimonas sp.]